MFQVDGAPAVILDGDVGLVDGAPAVMLDGGVPVMLD